jgi:hypothetical protein
MKVEYVFPDKEKIKHEIKIKFKEEFLKLNNLKIGDSVTLEFPYQRVYKEPRKQENTVTWNKISEGILKEDENGYLYAESLELMDFYKWNDDNRRKPFYKSERRKSIYKFHIGFI